MEILRHSQLKLFEDSPGVSQTVRDVLTSTLEPDDAVSLLELSEEVAKILKCSRDQITIQVRQAVERIKGFRLLTIPTEKGRRTFVACMGITPEGFS